MNIFCGSLPWSIEESELKARFEAYGEVNSVRIITDRLTGKSKGFGFVEMPNDDEAQQAIDAIDGTEVSGRSIVVKKAEERKEGERKSGFRNTDSRSRFNRDGGGGGGYRGGDSRGRREGGNDRRFEY